MQGGVDAVLGARVELKRTSLSFGTPDPRTVTTDVNGAFTFSNLTAGTYELTAPLGLTGLVVTETAHANDTDESVASGKITIIFPTPSATRPWSDTSAVFTVGADATTAVVSGLYVDDVNDNGVIDATEGPLAGDGTTTMVELWATTGDPIAALASSPVGTNGAYALAPSAPLESGATYEIRATNPAGYGPSERIDGSTPATYVKSFTYAGVPITQRHFLYTRNAFQIGGTVYRDRTTVSDWVPNRAYAATIDTVPLSGVTVTLWRETDGIDAFGATDTKWGDATVTGTDGVFTFGDVRAGTYYVVQSPGTLAIQPTAAVVGAASTGVTVTPASAAVFKIVIAPTAPSPVSSTNNVFLAAPAYGSISGRAINDANVNGIEDLLPTPEGSLSDVTVWLWRDNPSGTSIGYYDQADDFSTTWSWSSGVPGSTPRTTSDFSAGPSFSWPNLVDGTYFLVRAHGATYAGTGVKRGETGVNSVTSYKDSTSDNVWYSDFPAAPDFNVLRVVLTTPSDPSPGTPAQDARSSSDNVFLGAAAPGTITGTLYDDRNHNGAFDGGETGIASASVQISYTVLGTMSRSVTTGADGSFTVSKIFSNLDYRVSAVLSGTLSGWVHTTPVSARTANSQTSLTGVTVLVANRKASISGLVFDDVNTSGLSPGGTDVRLEGVRVLLEASTGSLANAFLKDANGATLAGSSFVGSTCTDPNGRYEFANLFEAVGAESYKVTYLFPHREDPDSCPALSAANKSATWVALLPTPQTYDVESTASVQPNRTTPAISQNFTMQKASSITFAVLDDRGADGGVSSTVVSGSGTTANADTTADAAPTIRLYRDVNVNGCCTPTPGGDDVLISTLTSATGTFQKLRTGTYYLLEANASGWESTGLVVSTNGQASTATISGVAYSNRDVVKVTIAANSPGSSNAVPHRFLDTRSDGVTITGIVRNDVDGTWSTTVADEATPVATSVQLYLDAQPSGDGSGVYSDGDVLLSTFPSAAVGAVRASSFAVQAGVGTFYFGGLPKGSTFFIRQPTSPSGFVKVGAEAGTGGSLPETNSYAQQSFRVTVTADATASKPYPGQVLLNARTGGFSGWVTNDVTLPGKYEIGNNKDKNLAGAPVYLYRETNGVAGYQGCAVDAAVTATCDGQMDPTTFPVGAAIGTNGWHTQTTSAASGASGYAFTGLLPGTWYASAHPPAPTGPNPAYYRPSGTNLAIDKAAAGACFAVGTCSQSKQVGQPAWDDGDNDEPAGWVGPDAYEDPTPDDDVYFIRRTLSGSPPAAMSDTLLVFFVQTADFEFTSITDGVTSLYAGDVASFTAVVKNVGTQPGPGGTPVIFTLPSGTQAQGTGASANLCGAVYTEVVDVAGVPTTFTRLPCTTKPRQTLATNEAFTFTFDLKYPSDWVSGGAKSAKRSAEVTGTVVGAGDGNDVNDAKSETDTVVNAVVLATSVSAPTYTAPRIGPDAGTGDLTYTITVENQGPSDAVDVSLSSIVPASVTSPPPLNTTYAPRADWDVFSCTIDGMPCPDNTPGDDEVTWSLTSPIALGTMPGESGTWPSTWSGSTSKTIVIRLWVPSDIDRGTAVASLPGSLADSFSPTVACRAALVGGNASTIASDCSLATDLADAAASVTIDTHARIEVTKTGSDTGVVPGSAVIYTIKVENLGPSDARAVTLTDTPEAPLGSAVWCTDDTCDEVSGALSGALALGTLKPDDVEYRYLRASLPLTFEWPDEAVNTATVGSSTQRRIDEPTSEPDDPRSDSWTVHALIPLDLSYTGRLFVLGPAPVITTRAVSGWAGSPVPLTEALPDPEAPTFTYGDPLLDQAVTAASNCDQASTSWATRSLSPSGWPAWCRPWQETQTRNYSVVMSLDPEDEVYSADPSDPVTVALYRPVPSRTVTGSGWVPDPYSKSKKAFAEFSVTFKGTSATPSGLFQLSWTDASGATYRLRATNWSTGGLWADETSRAGSARFAFGGLAQVEKMQGTKVVKVLLRDLPFRFDVVQTGTVNALALVAYHVTDPHAPYADVYHEIGEYGSEVPFAGAWSFRLR